MIGLALPWPFEREYMQLALLAGLVVGTCAPLMGTFLVHKRLSLMGDGVGHVAFAGVAAGLLLEVWPVWTALVAAVAGAVAVEWLRSRGRASGDLALALLFYSGIAAGVVLIGLAGSLDAGTLTYLFGSILTVEASDAWTVGVLGVVLLVTVATTWRPLLAVVLDEEAARVAGLPVDQLNLLLAVLTAVTVVVSMRVVGLLLISALMIIPNATAQLLGRSFAASVRWAVGIGVVSSVGGVVTSYYAETPSGGTIVLLAIGFFVVAAVATAAADRVGARRHHRAERHDHEHGPECGHPAVVHEGLVDYVHDGHLHAAHEGHYDEHHELSDPHAGGADPHEAERQEVRP